MPEQIWIVISTELGRFSKTPMVMESNMFTKKEATKYATDLSMKYAGDFYILEVNTSNKELIKEIK